MESHLPSATLTRTAVDRCPITDPEAAGRLHDLANMIQVVSSGMRLLERHAAVQAAPTLRPIVGDVLSRTERAGAMVRDMLRGEVLAQPSGVADPATVIAGVRRDLAAVIGRRIRLVVRCAARLPLVACPAAGLEDALINLVFNARDALPEGGLIMLRARPRREGGIVVGVELSVDDTGEGNREAGHT